MWRDYDHFRGTAGAAPTQRPAAGRGSWQAEYGGELMTVYYSGLVFDVAVNPFAVTSDHLAVPLDERDRAAMNTTGLFP